MYVLPSSTYLLHALPIRFCLTRLSGEDKNYEAPHHAVSSGLLETLRILLSTLLRRTTHSHGTALAVSVNCTDQNGLWQEHKNVQQKFGRRDGVSERDGLIRATYRK
jgi:hypothetical protein